MEERARGKARGRPEFPVVLPGWGASWTGCFLDGRVKMIDFQIPKVGAKKRKERFS